MSNLNSQNSVRPVTVEYIKKFLAKKESGKKYMLKTRYGKALGEKFTMNYDLIRRRTEGMSSN